MASSRKIYYTNATPTGTTEISFPYDTIIDGSLVSPQAGDMIIRQTSTNNFVYIIKEITYGSTPTIICQSFGGGGGSSVYINDTSHKMIIE